MKKIKTSALAKYLLILSASALVAAPAVAQNKIAAKQYKKPATIVEKQIEPAFGAGFVSSSAAHVRTQIDLCAQATLSVDPEKAYDHLVKGVGASGWTYGTQECWLFVSVPKSSSDVVTDTDYYFFKGIDLLQKDGILPNPLIEREMPGATQLTRGESNERAVLAVRVQSLR